LEENVQVFKQIVMINVWRVVNANDPDLIITYCVHVSNHLTAPTNNVTTNMCQLKIIFLSGRKFAVNKQVDGTRLVIAESRE
jgi:hypothetical protein